MAAHPSALGTRLGRLDVAAEDELSREPRYAVAAVAVRCGIQVQTLRHYERIGLIEPAAVDAGLRLYSEVDVARRRRIQRLISDLGVNLAGFEVILHMLEQLLALRRELAELLDGGPGR